MDTFAISLKYIDISCSSVDKCIEYLGLQFIKTISLFLFTYIGNRYNLFFIAFLVFDATFFHKYNAK